MGTTTVAMYGSMNTAVSLGWTCMTLGRRRLDQLEHEYHLHPLHVHETVQRVQHNQVEREKGYLFLVQHFPVLDAASDKVSVGQVGVFLGKRYVITIHTERSVAIDDAFAHCTSNVALHEMRSSAYLLYVIIAKLLANIERMTEEVDTELDEVEGLVFGNNSSDAERIGRIRQKIIRLRRLDRPQEDPTAGSGRTNRPVCWQRAHALLSGQRKNGEQAVGRNRGSQRDGRDIQRRRLHDQHRADQQDSGHSDAGFHVHHPGDGRWYSVYGMNVPDAWRL